MMSMAMGTYRLVTGEYVEDVTFGQRDPDGIGHAHHRHGVISHWTLLAAPAA